MSEAKVGIDGIVGIGLTGYVLGMLVFILGAGKK